MARKASSKPESSNSTATIGFEAKLWLTADKPRNNMDAAEPSGARQTARQGSPKGERGGANQYKAENVFWVPADARWTHLQASAKQPTIGKTVDDAMVAIERDNPRLKGVLPKDYARPGLDKQRLGELIATIELTAASEGEKTHRSVDLLGRVYAQVVSEARDNNANFAWVQHFRGSYAPSSATKLLSGSSICPGRCTKT